MSDAKVSAIVADSAAILRAEAEARFPGITTPATVWHANEIIRRLDRLIEFAERQAEREARR